MTNRLRIRPLLLLVLAGCGQEEAPAPAPPASVVREEEWSTREIGHTPRYFLASGWAGADSVWGLAGNTPVFVHVTEPEYRSVRRSYWEMAVSATGKVAGIDERGVWVEERLVLDRSGTEGDLSGPLLWSPDGARLLVRRVREGPSLHLLIDVASGAVTPLPQRADSLWLGEPFWTPDGRILLTGHPSLDPERGPLGRGDLYLHDPLRRVARAPEGVFLRPLSPWGAGGVLVGEGESALAPATRFRVYDTGSWTAREIELPAAHQVVAPDSTRALLVLRQQGEHDPVHRLSIWRGGQGVRPLMEVTGRELRVSWSPDGRRLAISAAGEVIDAASGSVEAFYRTWIAEPR